MQFLSERYETIAFSNAEDGHSYFLQHEPDIAVLDIMLPGIDGLETLKLLKSYWPECPVLMLTALDQVPKVVQAIKAGAFDYLTKPIVIEELFLKIEHALQSAEYRQEVDQRRKLQSAVNKEYRLIGNSPALNHIRSFIKKVAGQDTNILIEGETGTGKEIVAREIHAQSQRATKPFVAINCAALPKELIESELFGYKKGAFTGAYHDDYGKFYLANHGTLLLDEIAELPLEAQAKFLRVLEEKEYYPVGSNTKIKTDVRILASTNRDLRQMAAQNKFREDLYYRLNIVKIYISPLRERKEDILPIAEWYMRFFNAKFDKHFSMITPEAANMMLRYNWPGNVRELRNLIERIVLLGNGEKILPEDLCLIEPSLDSLEDDVSQGDLYSKENLNDDKFRTLSLREKQILLMIAKGQAITEIAEALNISVKTVSTFRKRILLKMNLKNNADICYYAIQNKLLNS